MKKIDEFGLVMSISSQAQQVPCQQIVTSLMQLHGQPSQAPALKNRVSDLPSTPVVRLTYYCVWQPFKYNVQKERENFFFWMQELNTHIAPQLPLF